MSYDLTIDSHYIIIIDSHVCDPWYYIMLLSNLYNFTCTSDITIMIAEVVYTDIYKAIKRTTYYCYHGNHMVLQTLLGPLSDVIGPIRCPISCHGTNLTIADDLKPF